MREVRLSVEKAVEAGHAYVRLTEISSLKIVCIKYMYAGFLWNYKVARKIGYAVWTPQLCVARVPARKRYVMTPQTFHLADDRLDPASAGRACRVLSLTLSGRATPHWIRKTGISSYNGLRSEDSDSKAVWNQ